MDRRGVVGRLRVAPLPPPSTVRERLLHWYRRNRRSLPWRRTRDPYAILVSEVMLQQTTVRAMLPYYRAFIERFPDWRRLAEASEDEILSSWAGLGYYARARNLHRTARRIVAFEGGRFPRDAGRARSLPGVGDYTAGAVLSIAYGLREPALDANASRVLARFYGVRGELRRGGAHRRLRSLAVSLLGEENGETVRTVPAGELNQALMELGALVCSAVSPDCPSCPLREDCRALALGRAGKRPARSRRRATVEVASSAALIRKAGCLLLARRGEGELMGHFWELPGTFAADLENTRKGRGGAKRTHPLRLPVRDSSPRVDNRERDQTGPEHRKQLLVQESVLAERLADHLSRRYGLRAAIGALAGRIRHAVTFRRILLMVFEARLEGASSVRGDAELLWVSPERLAELPVATLTRKAVSAFALGGRHITIPSPA